MIDLAGVNARLGCTVGAALLLCLGGPASAQDSPKAPPDYEAARRHYESGEQAAHQADWTKAAREYGMAYEITKDPVLFYKIATAYDASGDCTSALVYYGRYLKEAKPEERFRTKTEEKIAACEATIQTSPSAAGAGAANTGGAGPTGASDDTRAVGVTGAPAGGAAPSGMAADPERVPAVTAPPQFQDDDGGPSWQRTAGWASVGAVVTFATIGAVLGLSAKSREEDIQNLFVTAGEPETYEGAVAERYDDLVDEGEKLEVWSYAAFGAAGVAAAASVVFFLLDDTPASSEGNVVKLITPTVQTRQVGLTAGWTF
jgi:hypothetical protein